VSHHGTARVILAVLLLGSAAGCAGGAADPQPPTPEPSAPTQEADEAEDAATTAPDPTASEPAEPTEEVERAPGDVCRLVASTIEVELRRWAGADDVTQAPIATERLGPQPDDGVPGVLVDGCVWEVRGPAGGHIGVAVEHFSEVDMAAIETMGRDAGVEPTGSADGARSWHVPPSGETPSGAVLVGDREHLVVVRVESYSESDSGAPLGDDERAERFFQVVGDAIQVAQSD
jgi:hypothetical protein